MDSYAKEIRGLAKNKTKKVFLNSSPEHGIIIMSNIFEYCQKEVRIFAGNLNGEMANNKQYRTALHNFLFRDSKLKILLQEYDPENEPPIFKTLKLHHLKNPDQIWVGTTTKRLMSVKPPSNDTHFTVGDGRCFRIETDTKSYKASGNFNHKSVAFELEKIFDMIQEKDATQISLDLN